MYRYSNVWSSNVGLGIQMFMWPGSNRDSDWFKFARAIGIVLSIDTIMITCAFKVGIRCLARQGSRTCVDLETLNIWMFWLPLMGRANTLSEHLKCSNVAGHFQCVSWLNWVLQIHVYTPGQDLGSAIKVAAVELCIHGLGGLQAQSLISRQPNRKTDI